MTRLNHTSARRRNPHAWAPAKHNAEFAVDKAVRAAEKRIGKPDFQRWLHLVADASRKANSKARAFAGGGVVSRNPAYEPAGVVHPGHHFAAPGTPGSFEERLPDETNPPLTAEVIRAAADRMRANGERVRQQPLGTIWAPEPLGRKSDYVLASGGPA